MAEFPSQTKNRAQWIVDTVRANQMDSVEIIRWCLLKDYARARTLLLTMHKMDRDALLTEGGILTKQQLSAVLDPDL